MLVQIPRQILAFPWVDSTIKFHDNAMPATCALKHPDQFLQVWNCSCDEHPEDLWEKLQSIFLAKDAIYKSVESEDRITDIALWSEEWPTTIDELIFNFVKDKPPTEGQKDEKKEDTPPETKMVTNTALLQTAMRVCTNFDVGWDLFVNRKIQPRQKLDRIQEDNIEHFLKETVTLIAFDAYEIINLLILREGMKKSTFGNYEFLMKDIDNEEDYVERAKKTRKLVNILESKIPASVKMQQSFNITPLPTGKIQGSRDMQEKKMVHS